MSNSFQPHGLQHTRLHCPSLSPRICLNSHPLSQWCYLIISSSATTFSFAFNLSQHRVFSNELALCLGWPKCWCISFSISLPVNVKCLFPFGLAVLISLQSQGLSRVFSSTIWKDQFFGAQPSLWSNSHLYMTTGKTKAVTIWTFVGKVMSLLFNTLSGFVIAFLPRSSVF